MRSVMFIVLVLPALNELRLTRECVIIGVLRLVAVCVLFVSVGTVSQSVIDRCKSQGSIWSSVEFSSVFFQSNCEWISNVYQWGFLYPFILFETSVVSECQVIVSGLLICINEILLSVFIYDFKPLSCPNVNALNH